ncbi:hypothetical protein BDW69DRAFT_70105, partial [Aspergillus filifer]
MAPQPINLEPYKEEIIDLYKTGSYTNTIALYLGRKYDVKVSIRTIKSRLKNWGIVRNFSQGKDPALHARIKVLMYHVGLGEADILKVLRSEGYGIQARTLRFIRTKLGMLYWTLNPVRDQEQVNAVMETLRTELASGQIEGYGRRMLATHFRSQGLLIGRDRLFSLYSQLAPEAVQRRLHDLQRHRGAYIVPGPNFIWSIDGYLKLAPYGIEIYAAIDAYSRYIIWVYVGISSRTAVSVLRQFLDTLKVTSRQPRYVRSDRGGETVLLAEAQHKLQQSYHPEISIQDCYLYGTSTANQRIEAWWGQLTRGLLFRYRAYFQALVEDGHFFKDSLADQIALYAIYMPIISIQITSFVRTWNNHSIRRQRNRPHLVTGKPFINYYCPEASVRDQGIEFNPELFKSLQDDVQDWDPDEYLPAETYAWTRTKLLELGFDPETPPQSAGDDIDHSFIPFRTIYLDLRAKTKAHIESGHQPELKLSERPTGTFNWNPQHVSDGIEEVEYNGEPDENS